MPRSALRRFFRHGMFPQLMVFEAVARLGSVTRAADELHLAQPTVSTQLKKLQQSLEVALLEPEGRGLRLTDAGRELHAACGELFDLIGRMEERLQVLRRPPAEVLRVAAVPSARRLASRLLAEFCARHPGVQASLHVDERARLAERMERGDDDVYLLALDDAADADAPYRQWSLAHASGRERSPLAQQFARDVLLDGLGADANNRPGPGEGGEHDTVERRP